MTTARTPRRDGHGRDGRRHGRRRRMAIAALAALLAVVVTVVVAFVLRVPAWEPDPRVVSAQRTSDGRSIELTALALPPAAFGDPCTADYAVQADANGDVLEIRIVPRDRPAAEAFVLAVRGSGTCDLVVGERVFTVAIPAGWNGTTVVDQGSGATLDVPQHP